MHAAGKPSRERAAHLTDVKLLMLFLKSTRDALAELKLIKQVAGTPGKRATLHVVDCADHSFHVRVRSGPNDEEVLEEFLDTMAAWMLRPQVREIIKILNLPA